MKKFEIGKSVGDVEKFNAWFQACSRDQIPYIIVKKAAKFASVEWDYVSFDSEMDQVWDRNGEENKREFLKIFRKYAGMKSEFMLSEVSFFAMKVPIDRANLLAGELFDRIYFQLRQMDRLKNI